MLAKQKHIVKRQVYNISVSTQQNSHAIYNKISALNSSVVLPLIDKACCELNSDGSNIRIDKIEIDINDLNIDEFDPQLEKLIYAKFYEKLSHEIAAHVFYEGKDGLIVKTSVRTKIEKIEHYLISGLLPWWHSNDEEFDIVSELDDIIEEQPEEIKRVFLKNFKDKRFIKRISYFLTPLKFKDWLMKLYPANAKLYSYYLDDLTLIAKHNEVLNYSWQQALLVETILFLLFSEKEMSHENETVEQLQNLLLALCNNNHDKYAEVVDLPAKLTISFRSNLSEMVNQLKANLHKKVEKESSAESKSTEYNIPQKKPEFGKEEMSTVPSENIEKLGKESSLLENVEKQEREIPKQEVGKNLISLEQLKEKVFAENERVNVDREKIADNQDTQPFSSLEVQKEDELRKGELRKEDKGLADEGFKESNINPDNAFINQLFNDIQTANDFLKMGVDEIYINNAGLILLWPFLGKLFSHLKFRSEEGWLANNGRDKAVQLLQYMAIGNLNFKEHELTLNKILCGADIFYPVQPEILLVEAELVESNSLIESAIANWSALKSTSVEGFRVSFLQREGRLTLEDNGWKLYIERKGYDVLLDRLPWAISIIKNEWMPKPIYTEW